MIARTMGQRVNQYFGDKKCKIRGGDDVENENFKLRFRIEFTSF